MTMTSLAPAPPSTGQWILPTATDGHAALNARVRRLAPPPPLFRPGSSLSSSTSSSEAEDDDDDDDEFHDNEMTMAQQSWLGQQRRRRRGASPPSVIPPPPSLSPTTMIPPHSSRAEQQRQIRRREVCRDRVESAPQARRLVSHRSPPIQRSPERGLVRARTPTRNTGRSPPPPNPNSAPPAIEGNNSPTMNNGDELRESLRMCTLEELRLLADRLGLDHGWCFDGEDLVELIEGVMLKSPTFEPRGEPALIGDAGESCENIYDYLGGTTATPGSRAGVSVGSNHRRDQLRHTLQFLNVLELRVLASELGLLDHSRWSTRGELIDVIVTEGGSNLARLIEGIAALSAGDHCAESDLTGGGRLTDDGNNIDSSNGTSRIGESAGGNNNLSSSSSSNNNLTDEEQSQRSHLQVQLYASLQSCSLSNLRALASRLQIDRALIHSPNISREDLMGLILERTESLPLEGTSEESLPPEGHDEVADDAASVMTCVNDVASVVSEAASLVGDGSRGNDNHGLNRQEGGSCPVADLASAASSVNTDASAASLADDGNEARNVTRNCSRDAEPRGESGGLAGIYREYLMSIRNGGYERYDSEQFASLLRLNGSSGSEDDRSYEEGGTASRAESVGSGRAGEVTPVEEARELDQGLKARRSMPPPPPPPHPRSASSPEGVPSCREPASRGSISPRSVEKVDASSGWTPSPTPAVTKSSPPPPPPRPPRTIEVDPSPVASEGGRRTLAVQGGSAIGAFNPTNEDANDGCDEDHDEQSLSILQRALDGDGDDDTPPFQDGESIDALVRSLAPRRAEDARSDEIKASYRRRLLSSRSRGGATCDGGRMFGSGPPSLSEGDDGSVESTSQYQRHMRELFGRSHDCGAFGDGGSGSRIDSRETARDSELHGGGDDDGGMSPVREEDDEEEEDELALRTSSLVADLQDYISNNL